MRDRFTRPNWQVGERSRTVDQVGEVVSEARTQGGSMPDMVQMQVTQF